MNTLIIHLPGDERRAPNVAQLMSVLPEAQVLDAVRGTDVLARGSFPVARGDLHRPGYPFALRAGEVGCFLSHRAAWARIVAEGWDYALILEDDAALDPGLWPQVLLMLARRDLKDAYIRLPAKPREQGAGIDREGAVRLILPRRIGLQTVAQVVGRDAAGRLLDASKTIDRPVDAFLQMHWITGQPVHAVLPCAVAELTADLGGSTIQKKTDATGKLAREWNRMIYRARIALRPQG